MPLIDHSRVPTRSMQRWFGLSLAGLLWIIAYGISHYTANLAWLIAALGVLIAFVYYGLPRSQLPLIRLWQTVTFPVAFAISHLLLGLVFFGVVLPLGVALRLARYDPLRLRSKPRDSEWISRPPKSDLSRYFKQF